MPVDTLSVGPPPLSLARTLPAEAEVELKSCYVDILQMLASKKQSGATRQFTIYLTELSSLELALGSGLAETHCEQMWCHCLRGWLPFDPGLGNYYALFRQNVTLYQPKLGQPRAGCRYKVDLPKV